MQSANRAAYRHEAEVSICLRADKHAERTSHMSLISSLKYQHILSLKPLLGLFFINLVSDMAKVDFLVSFHIFAFF